MSHEAGHVIVAAPTGDSIQTVGFLLLFALLEFGVPIYIVWASYSSKCTLDLRTLWVHNERIDKLAVITIFTWWTHTCSIILWTFLRTITTTDYLTYMGWAIPIIASMVVQGRTDAVPITPSTPSEIKP